MLDNGGAAFNEVTGINVGKCTHGLDFGMVDMSANDPIQPLIVEGIDDALLVIRNELNRIFDLELDEGRQRKMGLDAEKSADRPQCTIGL